jgi:hypothetical protein
MSLKLPLPSRSYTRSMRYEMSNKLDIDPNTI